MNLLLALAQLAGDSSRWRRRAFYRLRCSEALIRVRRSLLNLALLFFNLIPLGPLDGGGGAGQACCRRRRSAIAELDRKYGMLILLVLFLSP